MNQSLLPASGNTEHTRPENRAFYPALDGLRAIAFLMVFFWHYIHMPWGWAGVNIFFVLSGFLITGILFDTQNDPQRARKFYIRRTLRIFPLYYGVLLCIAIAWPLAHWNWNWMWIAWPLYLGNFLQLFRLLPGSSLQAMSDFVASSAWHGYEVHLNLGHFWSLCVEEQFYLFWPWIVFRVRDRKRLIQICCGAIVVCLIARIAAAHTLPSFMIRQGVLAHVTFFRLDDLLAGGLVALLLRGPNRSTVLRSARVAGSTVLLAGLATAVLLVPRHVRWTAVSLPSHTLTWGFTVIQIFTCVLLLLLVQPGTWLTHVFAARPLRWLGRLSYGAYVYHDIFHHFYVNLCLRWFPLHSIRAGTCLGLVMTCVLAWISFRYFETPFLNLKERWAKSDARPVTA